MLPVTFAVSLLNIGYARTHPTVFIPDDLNTVLFSTAELLHNDEVCGDPLTELGSRVKSPPVL
jgi:hypothetical protein